MLMWSSLERSSGAVDVLQNLGARTVRPQTESAGSRLASVSQGKRSGETTRSACTMRAAGWSAIRRSSLHGGGYTPVRGEMAKETIYQMDADARLFAVRTVRLQWLEARGVEFQKLFADLMESAWPQDFQRVSPYGGSLGDLKCDGYWNSQKCVFQCYGPVSMRERDVIRKIKEDLSGAITHWHGRMARWAFVHNHSDGLTARVVQLLDDLRKENPDLKIEEWAWPQVRDQVYRLSDEAISDLYGYQPMSNSADQPSFDDLRPVVEQIAKGEPELVTALGNLPSVKKLDRNDFDADSRDFIRLGRQRVSLVADYFEEHPDAMLGDRIARAMQVQYQMLTRSGLDPSRVLLRLQQFAGWGLGDTNNHFAAVLGVITYFFDRCEIFEDPNGETEDASGDDG